MAMKNGQFLLTLRPQYLGSYTRVHLTGSVPTSIPPQQIQRLIHGLAFWSGYSVACALCVDAEAVGWCDFWSDALAALPEHHLQIRLVRDLAHAMADHER
jgi:hypothetical protein